MLGKFFVQLFVKSSCKNFLIFKKILETNFWRICRKSWINFLYRYLLSLWIMGNIQGVLHIHCTLQCTLWIYHTHYTPTVHTAHLSNILHTYYTHCTHWTPTVLTLHLQYTLHIHCTYSIQIVHPANLPYTLHKAQWISVADLFCTVKHWMTLHNSRSQCTFNGFSMVTVTMP